MKLISQENSTLSSNLTNWVELTNQVLEAFRTKLNAYPEAKEYALQPMLRAVVDLSQMIDEQLQNTEIRTDNKETIKNFMLTKLKRISELDDNLKAINKPKGISKLPFFKNINNVTAI